MKKWIKNFYLLFIVLVILLIIFKFDEIKNTLSLIKGQNVGLLFLALIAQILTYFIGAFVYKNLLNIMGQYVNFFKLFKISIIMTFSNNMLPSFGISGSSILFHSLKNHHKVSEGKILIVIGASSTATAFAFLLVLLFGFFNLAIKKNLEIVSFIFLVLSAITIIINLFLIYDLVNNKKIFVNAIEKISTKILRLFKKEFNKKRFYHISEEFYEGFKIIKDNRYHFFTTLFFSTLKILLDVITIYLIFFSFNQKISVSIIIVGLLLGSILGLLSLLPGGLGIFEITTAGIYAAFGISFNIALAAVLLFRLLSYWLPNLVGFLLYRNTLIED